MANIDQVKYLLKSGDTAGAEALCRKALEAAPDDARLSLYLATCRRLQGDEESFRRIMLELAPKMEALLREDPDCEAARLWRKSGAVLMEYVVLGVLVVAAVVGGVMIFGERMPTFHRHLYGPAIDREDLYRTLYGPAIEIEREIMAQPTNGEVSATVEASATTNTIETAGDSAREVTP